MMLHLNRVTLFIASLAMSFFVVSGCASDTKADVRKALVTTLNASQKQSIEDAISTWFGGVKITIADDAFSKTPHLTIERKAQRDSRGLPIEGRHDNPVFSFTLLSNGEQCLLRNEQSGELAKLESVSCYFVSDA